MRNTSLGAVFGVGGLALGAMGATGVAAGTALAAAGTVATNLINGQRWDQGLVANSVLALAMIVGAGKLLPPDVPDVPQTAAAVADGPDAPVGPRTGGALADGPDGAVAPETGGAVADGPDGAAAPETGGAVADGPDGAAAPETGGAVADGPDGAAAPRTDLPEDTNPPQGDSPDTNETATDRVQTDDPDDTTGRVQVDDPDDETVRRNRLSPCGGIALQGRVAGLAKPALASDDCTIEVVKEWQTDVHADLDEIQNTLDQHPYLKSDHSYQVNDLRQRWQEATELLGDGSDPEVRQLVAEEFAEIKQEAASLQNQLDERVPVTDSPETVPAFVRDDRVPLDGETILADDTHFTRTNKQRVKGAVVYTDEYGLFYHRDTLHTGAAAEIEVYDRNGNHLMAIDPITGEIKSGAVKGRTLYD